MSSWPIGAAAGGLLQTSTRPGCWTSSDVHVAHRICALGQGDRRAGGAGGGAGGARAARRIGVRRLVGPSPRTSASPDVPWPEPDGWLAAVRASPLLRAAGAASLRRPPAVPRPVLARGEAGLRRPAGAAGVRGRQVDVPASSGFSRPGYEEQREAAEIALAQAVTVLTGGPGTGKTTTVARLLALLAEQAELSGGARPRIALAAPTGKAAARLQEAVQLEVAKLDAADRGAARRTAGDDTASAAGQPAGHVVAVSARSRQPVAARRDRRRRDVDGVADDDGAAAGGGAPGRPADPGRRRRPAGVGGSRCGAGRPGRRPFGARATCGWRRCRPRTGSAESIGALAEAIRVGDADRALELLRAGGEHIEWHRGRRPVGSRCASVLVAACACGCARRRCSAPTRSRWRRSTSTGCCAHTADGPYGVQHWNRQVERWLTEETGQPAWSEWYAGRPLLVTANDYGLRLYNGDTGVVVARAGRLAGGDRRRRRTAGVRDQPALRRRDHARDDDPQKPRQPSRRGDGAAAARRIRGC